LKKETIDMPRIKETAIGVMISVLVGTIAIAEKSGGNTKSGENKNKATMADIRTWLTVVEIYKVDHYGRPPQVDNIEHLYAIGTELQYVTPKVSKTDAWGHAFGYRVHGEGNLSYTLASGGADGDGKTFNWDDLKRMQARDSSNWNCDIAASDGMFLFGECK
jgi:hypothetical protein